jgi:type IV pilus assembly protein PilM
MVKFSVGPAINFVALDIGSTAIRAVELRGNSVPKTLVRYASLPIDPRVSQSDAKDSMQSLSDAVTALMDQGKFAEKNIVVGIPSNKVFATVVDFPKLPKNELEKTVSYQLESHIPSPLDEVKVDWALLGDSPTAENQVEVLISSVNNSYAEARLDALENIGLNVIALEPDALALARSLVPGTATQPMLLLDIGDLATDLIITFNGSPRLIRSIPVGGQSFLKAAMQNLNVDQERAAEFVYKFGMNTEKLEGQVAKALQSTVDNLVNEVQKSIKFFTTRYKQQQLDRIIVSGRASTVPNLALYIANSTGVQVEIGNSWQNVNYPMNQHDQLAQVASHFTVAIGLGLRVE